MVRSVVAITTLAIACSSPPPVAPAAPVVQAPPPIDAAPAEPALTADDGLQLFEHNCEPCHSLDGSPRVGPSLKGYLGAKLTLADGTPVVGSVERLTASLETPEPLREYPQSMPAFKGMFDQRHVAALIAFVQSLH
jgi:mono/diheme cytochrome c family protein